MVSQAGGLVSETTQTEDSRVVFSLRIPAARLDAMLDELAGLGKATDRTVTARDVTDEAFDFEARLQNKKALRERLREHMASTTTLQEVLSVEEQLARVQTDIDALEGQIERLRTQVALSSVSLSLERETQLGPLGLVFGGLWTVLKKLVIWH
jgi:polyhydroxyalkanoate synthesis regulator phasin